MSRYVAGLILIGFGTVVFIGILIGHDSIKEASCSTYKTMITNEQQVP